MVKCRDCGFLAVWRRDDRCWGECDESVRETGRAEIHHKLDDQCMVRCFVGAADFSVQLHNPNSATDLQITNTVQESRDCDAHYPWVQGFTPKEHREMMAEEHLQAMIERRERDDRQWREEQAQRDQGWRQKQALQNHRWRVREFWWVGIGVPLLVIASTLLASWLFAD